MAASWGNAPGISRSGSSASQKEATTPIAAPQQDMASDSMSSCRTMRNRLAPMALRIANSCWRDSPCAKRRIEQLAQPMRSRTITECKEQRQGAPCAMHIRLDNRLNTDMEEGGKVFWCLFFELVKERLELCVCD